MYVQVLVPVYLVFSFVFAKDEPKFLGAETNVTVVEGRDATLTCSVENLQNFKVAWLRVDTQTILTIGPHVITKNHRVGVSRGDQAWSLALRDARPSDGGHYMCQINTEPMITQTHHLHVLVPPDIVDSGSGEVIVQEFENVSLHCAASGIPPPAVLWRREDSMLFRVGTKMITKWKGDWLNMTAVTRDVNGAFLCIATNGVPPSVSKRTLLHVLSKPAVMVRQKMVGVFIRDTVPLLCQVEAYPQPVIFWTHADGDKLYNGTKHQLLLTTKGHKHSVTLKVQNMSREDIGTYYCYAENSMGSARDDATVYTLATTIVPNPTETTALYEIITIPPHIFTEMEVTNEDPHDEDSFVVVLSQHQLQNLGLSPTS